MASETGDIGVITRRAYARVGLLGNPSDGYGGKCVSLAIENYHAEVRLTPNQQPFSPRICIEPGPHDVSNFDCLKSLATRTKAHGYYGGVRLLRALCYKFHEHCDANGLTLHGRGFTLDYKTNIPKQTGMSGSSALIVAALNCLTTHYDVDIPLDDRPTLALSAERDLGITAGLQDRVAQVYEGVVYMDFAEEARVGRGTYERLDAAALPPLYLVWCDNPSDSGKVHSDVRRRWDEGDALVRETMREVAGYAETGADALRRGVDVVETLGALMDANFGASSRAGPHARRKMFGDAALGAVNVDMIETARGVGARAKFTGSGGAIVAMCPDGEEQAERLKSACAGKGYVVERVVVREPRARSARARESFERARESFRVGNV